MSEEKELQKGQNCVQDNPEPSEALLALLGPLRGLTVKVWMEGPHLWRYSSITSAPSSYRGDTFDSGLILLNHKLS